MKKRVKRVVIVSVLPGEPTDGSGRVCTHLFVRDEKGLFVEGHVLRPAKDKNGNLIRGKLTASPARGRLACDPKRCFYPTTRNGVTTVTHRSDDPRAVNCPKCLASEGYAAITKNSK